MPDPRTRTAGLEGSGVEPAIHDRTSGRNAVAPDAGDNSPAPCDRPRSNPGTAPATRPAELTPTTTAAGFRIRFCTWCKQIDVRGTRRDTDVISIIIAGKIILATWNGKTVMVQDGICEACADCLKNGRVIDGSTTL
jgi:hypothetical protein